ncbi:MAG: carbohydrate ABC transporter permease [Pseudomonadota bacterium]
MSGRIFGALARHLFLALLAFVVLIPFLWGLSVASKPASELFTPELRILPETWQLAENFTRAWNNAPTIQYLQNGIVVAIAIIAFQLLFAVPFAYALAKLRFRLSGFLFGAVLVGLLIPQQLLAIPLFVMFHQMGVLNTVWALIIPNFISVFGVFLFRQFFKTIPDELLDAARVDGLGEAEILVRIVVPLAAPAITAFAIFSLVLNWNDLYWPLIAINNQNAATPPLGLIYFMNGDDGSDAGAMMAFALIVTTPLLLAFLLAQRRFVEGVSFTGIK